MIRPKIEAEYLLLSITKNCKNVNKKTLKRTEETLEFKMIKPKETFHSNPPIKIKRDWMIGLTDLEADKSMFNIIEEKNKFKLFKILISKLRSGGVSY